MTEILIWGGKGHAKVLRPILEAAGHRIALVYDRDATVPPPFAEAPFLTDAAALEDWLGRRREDPAGFVLAIGGTHGRERCRLAQLLEERGLAPVTAVHGQAFVAASAVLGPGGQVLAMAAVCVEARLGRQCIVNTHASVDHECVLGDGVHIMPGATLAGAVTVEDYATIGSNATILPRLRIGREAVVGAGAVVITDVPAGARVAGVPARPLAPAGTAR